MKLGMEVHHDLASQTINVKLPKQLAFRFNHILFNRPCTNEWKQQHSHCNIIHLS